MRRIGAVLRRHFHEAMRNPDRISDILLWPLIDVLTWGFFSRYLLRAHASLAAPAQLVAGIVLWGVFRAFQRDIAVGFLAEIWSRNMAGLFATPLSFGEYLIGLAVLNLAKLTLLLGLIALLCEIFTGMPGWRLLGQLLGPLGILLVFGAATGLFVTGLILRFSTRVQSLAYGLSGILMPVSCVFYPLTALPAPLRAIAAQLPSTAAFEAMRHAMQGTTAEPRLLLRGAGGALIALAAALVFFRGVIRATRRSGRMARMD